MCRTPAANAAPLLLVGGYRDNEVTNAAHPLWLFLDEIRNKGVSSNTIILQVQIYPYLSQSLCTRAVLTCGHSQRVTLSAA